MYANKELYQENSQLRHSLKALIDAVESEQSHGQILAHSQNVRLRIKNAKALLDNENDI